MMDRYRMFEIYNPKPERGILRLAGRGEKNYSYCEPCIKVPKGNVPVLYVRKIRHEQTDDGQT